MKKNSRGLLITVIIAAVIVLIPIGYAFYYYTTNYSLDLIGDKEVKLNLNGVYEEQGATAQLKGKDATDKIKITGKVNTAKPGKYTIKYSVSSITAKRTVTVGTKMNPEIKLDSNKKLTMKLGEKLKDSKYTATDEDGNDLTDKVKVDTSAIKRAGTGKVSYTVTDSKGNTTKVYRQVTVKANTDYDTPGLPICMFHYVYDENDPPEDLYKRYGNYISAQALEKELLWLKSENYYFPTWDEVRDYIDGKLILPDKSIVITFDDGTKNFMELGIPVLEKCKVPATSFVITKNKGEEKVKKYASKYVTFESHSHNMHRPGGNIGHGGIFTALSKSDALADLKKSTDIVGNNDAFAYPYGDYNDQCEEILKEAGFKCAVTTQPGKAKPGDDPYLLPRQRMSLGQSLEQFQRKVKPGSSVVSTPTDKNGTAITSN